MSSGVLYNGLARAPDLCHSRAFQYGDGVFRTCLVDRGRVVDLDRQVRKLAADARAIGLRPPPAAGLSGEMRKLAATRKRAVLKVTLFRAGTARGYAPPARDADRLLVLSDAPAYPAEHWDRGIRLARTGFRLGSQPRLAGIKHLNRLEQVLASLPRSTADEQLVCDALGRPLSGTRSNLFWASGGVLHTPRLDHCGVAGQMRGKIIASARKRRIAVREAAGSWNALLAADEVFVCNSLVGIWPVRQLGRRRWSAPGGLTLRLQRALRHPRLDQA